MNEFRLDGLEKAPKKGMAVVSGENGVPVWGAPGNGVGEHADLPDLLPDGITGDEANHINNAQLEFINDYVERRPVRPVNTHPLDSALNVGEQPRFESTPYLHPFNMPMYGYQLVIMQGNTTIYDSGNLQLTNTSFRIPVGFLDESQTYTWSVRYQGHQLNWSDWSAPTGFTTQAVFGSGFVLRPAILLPENGGVLNTPYPRVFLSSWGAAGAGLMQGQSTIQVSGDPTFATTIESVQTASRVWQSSVSYPRGEVFCVRARDTATTGEQSSWSSVSCFTVRTLFRQHRIGIVLTDPDNFVFRRVDGNFNSVDVDSDYWLENAVYAGLTASKGTTLFGQAMLVLPAFWINSGIVPTGQFAGKRFWMIDPTTPTQADRDAGWHRHEAFYNPAGGFQDSMPISAYRIQNVGGKALSVGNAGTPYVSAIVNQKLIINALNTDLGNVATRGWKMLNFMQLEAIKLLMLIEYGSLTAIFDLHTSVSVPYRGIRLWNGVNNGLFVDGIYNREVMLPDGTTRVSIPQMAAAGSVKAMSRFMDATDVGVSASVKMNDYLIPHLPTGGTPNARSKTWINVVNTTVGTPCYIEQNELGVAGYRTSAPDCYSLMVKMD